jgi:predicted dithiol-disulfide oxidoreductase (DUF899 family)
MTQNIPTSITPINRRKNEMPINIASREEWLIARKELLKKEKELTRLRDQISAQRRELPWVRVEKPYVFEGPHGQKTLVDLFEGRSQLLVYHFMLAPDSDHLCVGCCFFADHVDAARLHFEHNDLSFAAISRASIDQIEAVEKRMGWRFQWFSSFGTDFNYDYGVSFTPEQIAAGNVTYNYGTTPYASEDLPGTSVFYRDEAGQVFHTYSTYARGGDLLIGAYNFLDLAPKGRNEKTTMDWVSHHDRYGTANSDGCCHAKGVSAENPSLL